MTGAAHASTGAALGALFRSPAAAFAAGLASHLAADVVPHRDVTPRWEIALGAATLALIGIRHGLGSPEFWGALGGVAPDLEHGLALAGLMSSENEIFPTHSAGGRLHGPDSGERISQILISAVGLLAAEVI